MLTDAEKEEAQICSDCPGGLMCCMNFFYDNEDDEDIDYSCEVCGDYH